MNAVNPFAGRKLMLTIAAALFAVANADVANATPILVHQSTETYFSGGGTSITGCSGLGCTAANFTIGTATGTDVWSVQEKVFQDAATGQTTFSWTIFNDSITGTNLVPERLTSFHMSDNGVAAAQTFQPAGWTFSQGATTFDWSAPFASGLTLGQTASLSAVFNSLNLTVIFASNTGYDRSNALLNLGTSSQVNWVVSAPAPVPEPGTLLLLGSGAVGLWSARRRRGKNRV